MANDEAEEMEDLPEEDLQEGEDVEDELEEEDEAGRGPVTLGFCEPLDDDEEITRFDFQSKAGGRPAWLNPEKALTAQELTNVRGEVLDFLCQIYAPLGEDDEGGSKETFHRMLYVFAARTGAPPGCSSSLRVRSIYYMSGDSQCCVCVYLCVQVFRCQIPRENGLYPSEELGEEDPEPEETYADTICAVSGLRTTVRCAEMGGLPYASTTHQQLHWKMTKSGRSKAKKKGKPYEFKRPAVCSLVENDALFPEHSIDHGAEPDMKEREAEDKAKLDAMVEELETREGKEGSYTVKDFDGLRETFCPGTDPVYNRFRAKMGLAPRQCLRYDRGGKPLWGGKEAQPCAGEIEAGSDGSPRIFEFQILPPMLYLLDVENKAGVKNSVHAKAEAKEATTLDFATISIYTSEGGEPGDYIEEVAFLQPYGNQDNGVAPPPDMPDGPALGDPLD